MSYEVIGVVVGEPATGQCPAEWWALRVDLRYRM
jgi:hypothetical protein